MKAILIITLAGITTFACADSPTSAALTSPRAALVGNDTRFPVTISAWNPCALGGTGELVLLEGYFHGLVTSTDDAHGGGHLQFQFNAQGMSGTGQTSGATYRYMSSAPTVFYFGAPLPFTFTMLTITNLLAPGQGNNLTLSAQFHVTIDADGALRVDLQESTMECR